MRFNFFDLMLLSHRTNGNPNLRQRDNLENALKSGGGLNGVATDYQNKLLGFPQFALKLVCKCHAEMTSVCIDRFNQIKIKKLKLIAS